MRSRNLRLAHAPEASFNVDTYICEVCNQPNFGLLLSFPLESLFILEVLYGTLDLLGGLLNILLNISIVVD